MEIQFYPKWKKIVIVEDFDNVLLNLEQEEIEKLKI